MPPIEAQRTLAELIDKVSQVLVPSKHPRTTSALTELSHAVNAEFRYKFRRRNTTRKAFKNKVGYLSRKVKRLESELEDHKSAQQQKMGPFRRSGFCECSWLRRTLRAARWRIVFT